MGRPRSVVRLPELIGLLVAILGVVVAILQTVPTGRHEGRGRETVRLFPRAAALDLPATSDCPSVTTSVQPVAAAYAGEPFSVSLLARSGGGSCTLRASLAIALPGRATVTPDEEVEVQVGPSTKVTWTVLPTEPGPGSVVVLVSNSRGLQVGSFPIELTTLPGRRTAVAVEWMSALMTAAKVETTIDGGKARVNRSTVVTATVDLAPRALPSGLSAVADLEVCLDLTGVTATPLRTCQTTAVSLGRPSHIERLFPIDAPADRGQITAVAELRLTGQVDGKPVRGPSQQFVSDPGRAALGVGEVASGGFSALQALLTALGGAAGVAIVIGGIVAWRRRRAAAPVALPVAAPVPGPVGTPAAEARPTTGSEATTGTPAQG